MANQDGFPAGVRYIPIPSTLLGPLLEEIDSLAELKCTLRVVALVQQQRGKRLWVTERQLLADSVLANGLAETGSAGESIRAGLSGAVGRGTLLRVQRSAEVLYLINDERSRRAAKTAGDLHQAADLEVSPGASTRATQHNIYTLYEENIGVVTPMLAQEMEEAERTYPPGWIEKAFKEAVDLNRRNWRYIQRILERWATEGRGDGEPRRHTEAPDRKEYLRRYGNRTS